MARDVDPYESFADHPRYGRRPRTTGLNPKNVFGGPTHLHWRAIFGACIENTAIEADLNRQTPATIPVTHYFDMPRQCCDCGRPFIFFAAEQKFWYEELGFGLDSDCIRCAECRKHQRGVARMRERYEELYHIENKTSEEMLEMAECCLSLIESAIFSRRQTERVRMLLNRLLPDADDAQRVRGHDVRARLLAIESSNGGEGRS